MGVEYYLVNATKKELISFSHLNGNKKKELAGNPAQSAIVTWYLLSNQGDQIQFISDTFEDWPFETDTKNVISSYIDKTNELIEILIEEDILEDNGILYIDPDDPKNIYIRDIVNKWIKET